MRRLFVLSACTSLILCAGLALLWPSVLWLLLLIVPLILLGVFDMLQTRHTIWRNFPLIGHGRWVMELLRDPLHQYFVESDTDGAPISRMYRSVVYQRSKRELDTLPFGTELDVYRIGYEWMDPSLSALQAKDLDPDPRVVIGGRDCRRPYRASLLNISAMSFGALSKNAILALNGGAKIGGFFHNTGEGSVSSYHLEKEGELCWQVGTGYFGCRDKSGGFSDARFKETAIKTAVKMIEIKLSQGAKPGHGGILPADKNSLEIAQIRGVKPHTQVDSPPTHTAFSSPIEMMQFVQRLRELSGGKPVGFKLCLGRQSEFVAICKAIIETGIRPDFITVDGGEGGTGAAPLEYSNSVGMPLKEALAFVVDCLTGFDLKKEIRVIASGKIFTGFHILKNLALGADLCNMARGMMLALGCIQARQCNSNTCPAGVATQDPSLVKGLVVADKEQRVANFHQETLQSVLELLAAAGLSSPQRLNRSHIHRRISATEIRRYDEIFPYISRGSLLKAPYPKVFAHAMMEARAGRFGSASCVATVGGALQEVACP